MIKKRREGNQHTLRKLLTVIRERNIKGLESRDELIHRSDSFEGLVTGLLTDSEMAKKGIVSTYTGKDIEPM